MYSLSLGRFISADSIVPQAGNAQAGNRYAYARNSPLTRIDPSGHADCAAGDNACWQSEWGWKNRWYEAHGHFWENGFWSRKGLANFHDEGILRDTVGEAGFVFVSGLGLPGVGWDFSHEMSYVGQGIVALANKLGGLDGFAQLKSLLGNTETRLERNGTTFDGRVAYTEWWLGGNKHTIHFQDPLFGGSADFIRGYAVHEIAHIIDYNCSMGYGWLSSNMKLGYGKYVGRYGAENGPLEYFAQAFAMWILDSPSGNPFRDSLGLEPKEFPDELHRFFTAMLIKH